MAEDIIIQEGGKGARMRNVERIVTESQDGGQTVFVPETDRKSASKYIRSNGTYRAADDGLHSWSKVNVSVPGGTDGTATPTKTINGIAVPDGPDVPYVTPFGIGHSAGGYDDNLKGPYTVQVISGTITDPLTDQRRQGMPTLHYPLKYRPPVYPGEPFVPKQFFDAQTSGSAISGKKRAIVVRTGNISIGNTRTYVPNPNPESEHYAWKSYFTDSNEHFDEFYQEFGGRHDNGGWYEYVHTTGPEEVSWSLSASATFVGSYPYDDDYDSYWHKERPAVTPLSNMQRIGSAESQGSWPPPFMEVYDRVEGEQTTGGDLVDYFFAISFGEINFANVKSPFLDSAPGLNSAYYDTITDSDVLSKVREVLAGRTITRYFGESLETSLYRSGIEYDEYFRNNFFIIDGSSSLAVQYPGIHFSGAGVDVKWEKYRGSEPTSQVKTDEGTGTLKVYGSLYCPLTSVDFLGDLEELPDELITYDYGKE